ncbi:MAG: hypothetical protein ACHQ2F_07725 [Desulfobaccales bacterium]|jgi:hypothetical protein
MKTCECGQPIDKYRVFASYIPPSDDEVTKKQIEANGPVLHYLETGYMPHAYLECPGCGRIYLYSLKADILHDMTLMSNEDLDRGVSDLIDIYSKRA